MTKRLTGQVLATMTAPQLRQLLVFLVRTRKKGIPFGLNGKSVTETRADAIAAVEGELKRRTSKPNERPAGDPFGIYAIPPGDGRVVLLAW